MVTYVKNRIVYQYISVGYNDNNSQDVIRSNSQDALCIVSSFHGSSATACIYSFLFHSVICQNLPIDFKLTYFTGQYPNDSSDRMLVIFLVSSSPSTSTRATSLKNSQQFYFECCIWYIRQTRVTGVRSFQQVSLILLCLLSCLTTASNGVQCKCLGFK